MNPGTLDKLRSIPRKFYNPIWPDGTRQPYSQQIADYFFSLLSTSETSLLELLRSHPELPPWSQLNNWRRRKPEFAQAWRKATELQAHFLVQRCIDLYHETEPETAHATRVKFDILKWLSGKFHPAAYGDKPLPTQQSTTVNVGISITPERLIEIRSKLDSTRFALVKAPSRNGDAQKLLPDHASTPSIVSRTRRKELPNGKEHPKRDVSSDSNVHHERAT